MCNWAQERTCLWSLVKILILARLEKTLSTFIVTVVWVKVFPARHIPSFYKIHTAQIVTSKSVYKKLILSTFLTVQTFIFVFQPFFYSLFSLAPHFLWFLLFHFFVLFQSDLQRCIRLCICCKAKLKTYINN